MDSFPSTTTPSADASPSLQQLPWSTSTSPSNGNDSDTNVPPSKKIIEPKSSPSAIAIRSFFLGLAFGLSLTLTFFLLQQPSNRLWRAPFFLAALSLFHFLEFYVTALYNPPAATTSAFLLTGNGYAYNAAHTLALIECIFGNYVVPRYISQRPYLYPFVTLVPAERGTRTAWLILGFALLVVGQATRTIAMAQAATNFTHLISFRKKESHVLVTDGVYRWLRHPAYFGFFWWGLGTQIVMGNAACFVGYAMVLWRFFKHRIESECLFLSRCSMARCGLYIRV